MFMNRNLCELGVSEEHRQSSSTFDIRAVTVSPPFICASCRASPRRMPAAIASSAVIAGNVDFTVVTLHPPTQLGRLLCTNFMAIFHWSLDMYGILPYS